MSNTDSSNKKETKMKARRNPLEKRLMITEKKISSMLDKIGVEMNKIEVIFNFRSSFY